MVWNLSKNLAHWPTVETDLPHFFSQREQTSAAVWAPLAQASPLYLARATTDRAQHGNRPYTFAPMNTSHRHSSEVETDSCLAESRNNHQ